MLNAADRPHFSWPAIPTLLLLLSFIPSQSTAQLSTKWQLNSPYRCPDGRSYTITKRAGAGMKETCWYHMERNGQFVTDAVIHCAQMAGMLNGCSVESAAQSQPARPTEDWNSRATNPPYLSVMPYVEKVKSTIKGTSPDDTLARQLTVFTYLREMIGRMRDASRPFNSPWTPDETNINYDYDLARKQITDDYTKTHTPEQLNNLQHLAGHYQFMDDDFYRKWTKALFPADFLAAYDKAAWGLLAQYNAHVDQQRKQAEVHLSPAERRDQPRCAALPGTGWHSSAVFRQRRERQLLRLVGGSAE